MNNRKILIVEDEEDIRELISFHMFRNKFEVLEESTGKNVVSTAELEQPDLIILDIMLPKIDGITICKTLKANPKTKHIKLIFLSAKGEEEDVVKGLELGADDYITKPFSPKILLARVNNILRKSSEKMEDILSIQGIKILKKKRIIEVNETVVNLTMTEFDLLLYLASHPGQVYTRSQIVNKIKGDNHAVTDRSVDTQLVSLRKKLGTKGSLIETVWGVGYRFKDNETK